MTSSRAAQGTKRTFLASTPCASPGCQKHESSVRSAKGTYPLETVITVCGNADQACPIFPGQVNRHHWPFEDPAHATGTDEEKLAMFRRVRNEIRRVFTAYADGRRDQMKSAAKGGT